MFLRLAASFIRTSSLSSTNMPKGKFYYAVRKGFKPGVYTSWWVSSRTRSQLISHHLVKPQRKVFLFIFIRILSFLSYALLQLWESLHGSPSWLWSNPCWLTCSAVLIRDDCKSQVDKYPAASFKKFGSEPDAWAFVRGEASSAVPGDTTGKMLQIYNIIPAEDLTVLKYLKSSLSWTKHPTDSTTSYLMILKLWVRNWFQTLVQQNLLKQQ